MKKTNISLPNINEYIPQIINLVCDYLNKNYKLIKQNQIIDLNIDNNVSITIKQFKKVNHEATINLIFTYKNYPHIYDIFIIYLKYENKCFYLDEYKKYFFAHIFINEFRKSFYNLIKNNQQVHKIIFKQLINSFKIQKEEISPPVFLNENMKLQFVEMEKYKDDIIFDTILSKKSVEFLDYYCLIIDNQYNLIYKINIETIIKYSPEMKNCLKTKNYEKIVILLEKELATNNYLKMLFDINVNDTIEIINN